MMLTLILSIEEFNLMSELSIKIISLLKQAVLRLVCMLSKVAIIQWHPQAEEIRTTSNKGQQTRS